MACRNERKCALAVENALGLGRARSEAAFAGKAFAMSLDLGDLASVYSFSEALMQKFPRIDILINNAGFNNVGSTKASRPTAQGLEDSFGSMHVGHFALTELLLQRNINGAEGVTVVNVASGMHHLCLLTELVHILVGEQGIGEEPCLPTRFLETGFVETGKPDFLALPSLHNALPESAAEIFYWNQVVGDMRYNRAKLANVLHAAELPKRHPGLSAYSVDLGFVVTNVTGWLRQLQEPIFGVLPPLQSLGLVRTGEPHGIRPILLAACAPNAKQWMIEQSIPPLINGGLVDPAGDAEEPFVIERTWEELLGVSNRAPNRTALASALHDATAKVLASIKPR
eukprot:TRINITY_DN14325_c0_g1_i1.p1 TRINITY_DN14325_c0_g1~~TRINITY_DN14325_c0_g1_i1.p1  ORF type:complete len:341 (-),score=66.07 TRINITY_DN14325_c0_g1_i1:102-1124(-)